MSDSIATGAVHHMALTVSDVQHSREFYTRYLGFQFVTDFGPRAILSNGSVILALTPPPDPSQAIANDSFNENRIGLDHVSLSIPSLAGLEAAAAFLDENGVTHGEINDLGEGLGIYVMTVRDPDNIQLELTAPH
jgi:catechol 2,3-dioxygenase-like lactoylglutathione lyase family enzyme